MNKIFILVQTSNVDGEYITNVTPCASMDLAKKLMQEEIDTLFSSGHYSDYNTDAESYLVEGSTEEGHFYIKDNTDDYWEDLNIEEKTIATEEPEDNTAYTLFGVSACNSYLNYLCAEAKTEEERQANIEKFKVGLCEDIYDIKSRTFRDAEEKLSYYHGLDDGDEWGQYAPSRKRNMTSFKSASKR